MYEPRFYRDWLHSSGLVSFEAVCRESDLLVRAHRDLRAQAQRLLEQARRPIEEEILRRPDFLASLAPLAIPPDPAPIVRRMYAAAAACGVGPMAAVAGAVAQAVGEGLLRRTPEVIVENGGDLYVKMDRPVVLGLFAGAGSPFTGSLRITVDPAGRALGVCTSSGTVGHSLSFGRADAVMAVADDAALADAAATAICNRIQSADDVEPVLEAERRRGLLAGLVIAIGERLGAFGIVALARG